MKHMVDMTNEERLEKLERELARVKRDNRRMIIVGMGIVLGVLALWVVFGSPVSVARAQEEGADKTVIRAHEFVLVEEQGETRAILGLSEFGPTLEMYNEQGEPRVTLDSSEFRTRLALYDKWGERGAVLYAGIGESGLEMFGYSKDVPCAKLSVLGISEYSGLILADEQEEIRAFLVASKYATGLSLYDDQGKETWRTPR